MLEENKSYKMTFFVFGKTLTFTGKIIELNDFIKFKDKFGEIIIYNKNCLAQYIELNGEEAQ